MIYVVGAFWMWWAVPRLVPPLGSLFSFTLEWEALLEVLGFLPWSLTAVIWGTSLEGLRYTCCLQCPPKDECLEAEVYISGCWSGWWGLCVVPGWGDLYVSRGQGGQNPWCLQDWVGKLAGVPTPMDKKERAEMQMKVSGFWWSWRWWGWWEGDIEAQPWAVLAQLWTPFMTISKWPMDRRNDMQVQA